MRSQPVIQLRINNTNTRESNPEIVEERPYNLATQLARNARKYDLTSTEKQYKVLQRRD